ncbi:hypothetical protein B0H63DRAFT_417196 [Podospora didyma]|uniref:Rhodopsin domain-containing protein n=1 Tax=Podospora didyma TaxID=330526 RepID=A0AAE0KJ37_9PEZI|nr:hypothetical protein B0H63DRAFT_417196 [Podospora didyma]
MDCSIIFLQLHGFLRNSCWKFLAFCRHNSCLAAATVSMVGLEDRGHDSTPRPLPPNTTSGPRTLAVLVPLFAFALLLYVVRIWTRLHAKQRLTAADYTITVAVVAETISIAFTAAAVSHGFGHPPQYLSKEATNAIGELTFVVFVVALWASCFGRISVACLLLQFTQHAWWRAVLWATVAFQMVALVGCSIVELIQCRPIRAAWDPEIAGAQCFALEDIWANAYVFIAIAMFSDAIFATLPILIIWRLSRSVVERTLISILMGLGLFALGSCIIKIFLVQKYNVTSEDNIVDMMPVFLWTRVEEIIIIIGACAPLLKSTIEGMLHRRFGVPRFLPTVRELNSVRGGGHAMLPSAASTVRFGKATTWRRGSSTEEIHNDHVDDETGSGMALSSASRRCEVPPLRGHLSSVHSPS